MDEQPNPVNPDEPSEQPQPGAAESPEAQGPSPADESPAEPQAAQGQGEPGPENEDPLARAMAAEAAADAEESDPGEAGEEAGGESAAGKADDPFTSIQMPDGPVPVGRAEFGPLPAGQPHARGSGNIELLLDVNLPVSIELGRTHMSISDILELGSGSIVELDKLAGEPVDILVNSRPLAKGEVVVLDENFGVRITSLVSPRERLERLNLS